MAPDSSVVAPTRKRLPYYPALDGVRGIAVIAMLCFHSDFAWASGAFLTLPTFFVLSGFLITSLLLSEHASTGRIRLGAFWARRFRRLLPAALLGLGGIALFGYAVADPAQLSRLRADALSALAYVANWRFMVSGLAYEELFGRPSPVQHFWSLSAEEQFYLLYPPLALLMLKRGKGRRRPLIVLVTVLTVASAGLMAVLYSPDEPSSRVYYGTDTRAAEFLFGALLALLIIRDDGGSVIKGRWLQAAGATAAVAILVLWNVTTLHDPWIFRGGLMGYCLLNAVVITAGLQSGRFTGFMGSYVPRELGRISYGIYLYHWPIFLWLTPERTGLTAYPNFVLRLVVTIVLAAASYHGLERKIRNGQWLAGSAGWKAAALATAAVAGSLVFVTHDPPPPWFLHHGMVRSRPMPDVPADGSGPERILVVGDSVAWTLGRGLERWADARDDVEVWNIAIYGCGIARRGEVVHALGKTFVNPDCYTWADWWRVQIDNYRPHKVVMLTSGWDLVDRRLPEWDEFRSPGDPGFDRWLVSEYITAVDVLADGGARLFWLSAPCSKPDIKSGMLAGTGAFAADRVDHMNQELLPRVVSRRDAVELIDLYAKVCRSGEMIQDVGREEPLRPDGIHFSKPGADWVAEWLGPMIAGDR